MFIFSYFINGSIKIDVWFPQFINLLLPDKAMITLFVFLTCQVTLDELLVMPLKSNPVKNVNKFTFQFNCM